jgi:N-acetylglucosaminyl-diphospho-decaprenol L-rhamnosyltransferase
MDPLPLVPPLAPRRPRTRRSVVATPLLSVVVVNYQRWHDTAALVKQLRAAPCLRHGLAEVVVVDNHSAPHPVVGRLRRLAGVSLRRWRRNRGFARAVNEGCRLSRGDWLLLLNPDVTLAPDFLDGVAALAERLGTEEPNAGIVGFGLRDPDGSRQGSAGAFPTLARTLAGLGLPRAWRKYRGLPSLGRSRVDWVTGCCLLLRRACWEQLGGLDSDYFLYYEDVDLCRRAQAHGWSVWHEPSLSVVHHHPLHGREVPAPLRLITRHALLTYGRKHWPEWQFRTLACIVRVEAWLRRLKARGAGDTKAADAFTSLGKIACDLLGGQPAKAQRRLHRIVWQQLD